MNKKKITALLLLPVVVSVPFVALASTGTVINRKLTIQLNNDTPYTLIYTGGSSYPQDQIVVTNKRIAPNAHTFIKCRSSYKFNNVTASLDFNILKNNKKSVFVIIDPPNAYAQAPIDRFGFGDVLRGQIVKTTSSRGNSALSLQRTGAVIDVLS